MEYLLDKLKNYLLLVWSMGVKSESHLKLLDFKLIT